MHTNRTAIRPLVASLILAIFGCCACTQSELAVGCPPDCEVDAEVSTSQLRLTQESMKQIRTAAWKLLYPFTRRIEGLPSEPDWTSVTRIPPPPAKKGEGETSADKDRPVPSKLGLMPPQVARTPVDIYEAAFLNETAWKFARNLPTKEQLKQRFARDLELPPQSMTIKMFFYRVKPGEEADVRLWDWNKVRVSDLTYLDSSMLGTQCVMLEASLPRCIAARDHFYTVRVTKDNKSFFSCGARACASDAQDGDLLIMIGMHIASKQTPEWLWATFWWRGADNANLSGHFWTCQNAQRPKSIATADRWKNYSMDATASFQLLKPEFDPKSKDARCGAPPPLGDKKTPDPKNQQYLATYNPFVEADFDNGLKSSCVNCHSRASTGRNLESPPMLTDFESPHAQDFEWHVRLDYLWSLTRGIAPTSTPTHAP
jgi:hypothetical protein